MVTGSHRVFGCAANFLRGLKCVFCGSFRVTRTQRGYVKCRICRRQKSLAKLQCEIAILQGFYQQVPAYRSAHDLGVDPKVISRVYQKLRTALFHVAELEGMASKLSGEIESWTKLISVAAAKAVVAGVRLRKASCSGSWSGMDGSIPRSSSSCRQTPSWPIFRPPPATGPSTTRMPFAAIYCCDAMANITRSITAKVWLIVAPEITSMASRASGRLRNLFCTITGACPSIISRCI